MSFVKVRRVLDGDTIIISDQAQEVKIRLFGIDCPEGGQAWGNRAKSGLVKLIGGKMVYLETHGVDHYNRTKRKRVGLWKVDNPTPPWQWRSQKSA